MTRSESWHVTNADSDSSRLNKACTAHDTVATGGSGRRVTNLCLDGRSRNEARYQSQDY